MTAGSVVTLAGVALFVMVHVFGGKLTFQSRTPRSVWLSAAGGVSVSYVFVLVLPELALRQQAFEDRASAAGAWSSALENHAYLIAMLGLGLFYGIERFVQSAGRSMRGEERGETPLPVFWLHLAVFACYNVLIGYLLVHRGEADVRGTALYAVAMAVHFFANDQSLREEHGDIYHRHGRWLLAAAAVLGYLIGISTAMAPLLIDSLFALLAGSVILNVLKEELPEGRRSRFLAFATGAGVYTTLLMATA
jgi:hypothetical protein